MNAKARGEVYDVAVSGGGVVGGTLAGLLALQGFSVCLISRERPAEWDPNDHHPRVNAVNHSSIRIFRHLGIWEDIRSKRVSPYFRMTVWERDTGGLITFDARDIRVPHLGAIIENNAVTSSLFDFLERQPNVAIVGESGLQEIAARPDGLRLHTDSGCDILCRLLVGADGGESATRTLSGIGSTEYETGQRAIVAEVVPENGHDNTAWQVFLPTGPAALLPLRNGRCSLVWSCDEEYFDEMMALDDAGFCQALSSCFQGRPGEIVQCGKRHSFPLRQHHADTYIAERVALIGDAAHSIHPLAGLGANIGLLDAASLSQVLGQAAERGRDFAAHAALRRYERWRKGENAMVLTAMRGFKTLFGSEIPGSRAIGGAGLMLADRLAPLKKMLAGYAMGDIGDLPAICSASKKADI
ncbi:MAG: UbiH/UbiF/VisC/COQ6 family ubiquinone biosynthesis hydroxylase [Gammaproteobacteria bacterium]|nr:UbiH/UbiF/VisC/COQ6 family ubiquinone biosynthesis hydroxylase [Gammaproteobacteria bacterium]MYD77321.1 UbiH/UbiF/VisC/COQ6 family ubiquinone biosynthesis hydroxylase [Gammaproteobacteria bacterium]MYJ52520.1 UbiH/UbiF/VisC/COQ6 family ubiquinone biosynthesis hydroxylase [Gammaproteobacteria bacterium]